MVERGTASTGRAFRSRATGHVLLLSAERRNGCLSALETNGLWSRAEKLKTNAVLQATTAGTCNRSRILRRQRRARRRLLSHDHARPGAYDRRLAQSVDRQTAGRHRLDRGADRGDARGSLRGRSGRRGIAALGRRILSAGGGADSTDGGPGASEGPCGGARTCIRRTRSWHGGASVVAAPSDCGVPRGRWFRARAGGVRGARRDRTRAVPALYRSCRAGSSSPAGDGWG